ncbi:MAG: GMP synthase (glutamine-hydrolyzing), partial [SAR116 cluster bacterium]
MILIIDFGSQVTQLIARRLRDAGIYTEIMPSTSDSAPYLAKKPKGVILSGGPNSVTHSDTPRAPDAIWNNVPVLGICYGQQTMCEQLGGKVEAGTSREFGRARLEVIAECLLFENLPHETDFDVWMSHGDHVANLPDGFEVVARSKGAPFAAIANSERGYYGVQFHPEVVQTEGGTQILKNFATLICGCENSWSMAAYKSQAISDIKEQVGPNGRVICGLSGGVDSSVAAVLLHQAIGDRLTCVF